MYKAIKQNDVSCVVDEHNNLIGTPLNMIDAIDMAEKLNSGELKLFTYLADWNKDENGKRRVRVWCNGTSQVAWTDHMKNVDILVTALITDHYYNSKK